MKFIRQNKSAESTISPDLIGQKYWSLSVLHRPNL